MPRKNRLNNRMLRNMRKEPEYQAVITDLVLLGKLTKEEAKKVLGYEVPDYLSLDAASGVTPTSGNTPTPTPASGDDDDDDGDDEE